MRRTQFFQLQKGKASRAGFCTGTQTFLREAQLEHLTWVLKRVNSQELLKSDHSKDQNESEALKQKFVLYTKSPVERQAWHMKGLLVLGWEDSPVTIGTCMATSQVRGQSKMTVQTIVRAEGHLQHFSGQGWVPEAGLKWGLWAMGRMWGEASGKGGQGQ